jgi:hypothetical protein
MTSRRFNQLAETAWRTGQIGDIDALVEAVAQLAPGTRIGAVVSVGGKESIAEGTFLRMELPDWAQKHWGHERAVLQEVRGTRTTDMPIAALRAVALTRFRGTKRRSRP